MDGSWSSLLQAAVAAAAARGATQTRPCEESQTSPKLCARHRLKKMFPPAIGRRPIESGGQHFKTSEVKMAMNYSLGTHNSPKIPDSIQKGSVPVLSICMVQVLPHLQCATDEAFTPSYAFPHQLFHPVLCFLTRTLLHFLHS